MAGKLALTDDWKSTTPSTACSVMPAVLAELAALEAAVASRHRTNQAPAGVSSGESGPIGN